MALITLSNGKSFEAGAQEPLLPAALRAGLAVAHSCRNGRCGSCKAQLVQGDTQTLLPEAALSPAEQAAGWLLTCARTASSDLQLQLDLHDGPPLPAVRTVPSRIDGLQRLAPDVLQVLLRLPPQQAFGFLPGQHLDVIGPGGVRRAYSIANAPRADGRLELQVRRVPGGALSTWWFEQAQVNDLVRLHGPQGSLVMGDLAGRPLWLLATGTGIAPVKAWLEQLAGLPAEAWPASVHLWWGGRVPRDLYWDPLRLELPAPFGFTPVLSRAPAGWDGARGHVQAAALAHGAAQAQARGQPLDLSRHQVVACGSPAMVDSARSLLLAAGLPARQFQADPFVCSA
ncbi:MAG: FAD-binding oxidoreductase [Rubrivivax sp.]